MFSLLLNALAENEARNQMILDLTLKACETRARILLLSAFRDHATNFFEQLKSRGVSCELLLGGAKSKKRKREEEDDNGFGGAATKCTGESRHH
jgi:hypothetical protein